MEIVKGIILLGVGIMLDRILSVMFAHKAFRAAKKARQMSHARAQAEGGAAILYLRECRLLVRRETGINYGAMSPHADPDETPVTTMGATTTGAP